MTTIGIIVVSYLIGVVMGWHLRKDQPRGSWQPKRSYK